MTVAELIKTLQEFPGELEVLDFYYDPIHGAQMTYRYKESDDNYTIVRLE